MLAHMSERTIGTASLLRLLGDWRAAGRGAAHRQLVDTLRLLILDGRLALALRLPGERELAKALGLSRTTVSAAYNALRDEGFLVSRHGSGSVTSLPCERRRAAPSEDERAPGLIEFSVAALPANESVHRAYAAALAALPRYLPTSGYEAVGLAELRAVVAERYARLDVPTSPEQILVTQGAQQGFTLLLRLLAGPGDGVAVEHPTYSLALETIRRASCRIVPVALTSDGWDVEALAAACRQTDARIAFLQPDFQNPTGLLMPPAQRAQVVEALPPGCTIAVDETMSDLWLEGARPTPLAAFDRGGRVVTLGSTGKTFWGGLRIGWMRADARTIAALARVRASLDMGSPVLEQLAAAELLAEGDATLAARRESLRGRRDRLLGLARELLPEWQVSRPAGGLSIWAELPSRAATVLAAAAEAEGLRIAPGPRFGVDGAFERFVRLPFALPEPALETAMKKLALAWRSLGSGDPKAPAALAPERVPEPV